jgi:hypothetical protein
MVTPEYFEAQRQWYRADDAWSQELQRLFGEDAGDARYDKRGTSTTPLRALHYALVMAERTHHALGRKLGVWS